jgi:hypothetical protein
MSDDARIPPTTDPLDESGGRGPGRGVAGVWVVRRGLLSAARLARAAPALLARASGVPDQGRRWFAPHVGCRSASERWLRTAGRQHSADIAECPCRYRHNRRISRVSITALSEAS